MIRFFAGSLGLLTVCGLYSGFVVTPSEKSKN